MHLWKILRDRGWSLLQSTSAQNPKKTLKSFMPPTNSAWILRKVSYLQPIYSLYLLTVNIGTVLYFGKRGCENQRAMKSGDLQLKTTTGSHKYFILNERAANWESSWWYQRQRRWPVTCLEKYLAKREPQCDALLQKSKNHNASSFSSTDVDIWFCNTPLGKHKLENLLTDMCKKAGLAQVYTPHIIEPRQLLFWRLQVWKTAEWKM